MVCAAQGYLRYFANQGRWQCLRNRLELYTLQVRDDLRQSQSCFCLEPTKEGKRIAEQGARVYVLMAQNDRECTEWVNRIAKMWTWAKLQHQCKSSRVHVVSASGGHSGQGSLASSSEQRAVECRLTYC